MLCSRRRQTLCVCDEKYESMIDIQPTEYSPAIGICSMDFLLPTKIRGKTWWIHHSSIHYWEFIHCVHTRTLVLAYTERQRDIHTYLADCLQVTSISISKAPPLYRGGQLFLVLYTMFRSHRVSGDQMSHNGTFVNIRISHMDAFFSG